jgi:MFS family permease
LIYPAVIAWLSHSQESQQRTPVISQTLIRFCLAWNLGMICGQISGGWLFPFGRHWPIALAMTLAAADLVLVLMTGRGPAETIPEPTPRKDPTQPLSAAFAKLSWISNLGGSFSISMVFHLFPKLAVELGIPAQRHGTMLVAVRTVVIIIYLLMHTTRFWHHRFSTALTAQAAAVAGLLVLSLASTQAGLLAGLAGLGLLVGYNYFASLYYSTTGSGAENKGAASGIHEATLATGLAAGSFAGGIVGSLAGIRAPYLLAACVIATMATLQIVVYLRHVRPLASRNETEKYHGQHN